MYKEKYATDIIKERVNSLTFQLIDVSRFFCLDTLNVYQLIFILFLVKKYNININNAYNDDYSFFENVSDELTNINLDLDEKIIFSDSINSFLNNVNLLSDYRKIVCIINEFETQDYINLIKFINPNQFDRICYETPITISEVVNKIFDIKDNSNILDLCCGNGTYLIDAKLTNPTVKISGYDIDSSSITISKIKMHILNYNCDLTNEDTLVINNYEKKYDYVFCNSPFGYKYKEYFNQYENGNYSYSFKPVNTSIWRFVYKTINLLSEDGKGAVMLPLSPLFKLPDTDIRKNLIDLGIIEAIIELPKGIYYNTTVSSALMILSHNNKEVRFIDAKDCIIKNNELNINEIVDFYNYNSENSTAISNYEIANNNYSLLCSIYLNDVKSKMKHPVLLGDFINVTRGYQASINNSDNNYNNFVKIVNLSDISEGILNKETLSCVSYNSKMDKFFLCNNDLLITARGSRFECVVVSIEDNERIIASGNLLIVRITHNLLNPYYLKLYLESRLGQESLFRNQVKSSLLSINSANLIDTYIDLIDIEKQNRISKDYIKLSNMITEKINNINLLKIEINRLIEEV